MTTLISPALDDGGRLPSDISGLDRLSNPVWVFDPHSDRKLYANPSAVALWGAADLTSLLSRDFSSKSEAARIRTEQTLAAVKLGKQKADVWTFFPNGVPVSVRTVSSHLVLCDGSDAILFEAHVAVEPPDYLRALASVRHAQTVVSLYDGNGDETFGNPHAVTAYGARRSFKERCSEVLAGAAAWEMALRDGRFRGRLLMRTESGPIAHDVMPHRTIDPVTGDLAVLAYERDDSEKAEAETHLTSQARDLDEARIRAEAANEAKSTFLANMSHEIRTPLNGVVSLAELLCRSTLTPAQREAAELIRSSGRSLDHLLADILQLVQIEAGEVVVASEPVDLDSIARDVTNLMRLKAGETGATLDLRVDLPGGQRRRGDALRLRQILTNLISNAVKFTPEGAVHVIVEEQGDGVRVLVQDTGIDFTEDQKSRIFQRFQQGDGSITRRFGGSGLGLAITAELVARMGGKIGCDSTPGAGSCFWADLPLPVVNAAADATLEEDCDLHGLHVLVADDHPINRRVVEMILEPLGADVVSVENGAEAVDAVEHDTYDVVLMDMQMPVMDGLEATRAIVAAEGPPVIMVSANGMPEHIEAALEAGAAAHVIKPIEPATLVSAISTTVLAANATTADLTSATAPFNEAA